MKKIFYITFLLIMMLSFTSCKKDMPDVEPQKAIEYEYTLDIMIGQQLKFSTSTIEKITGKTVTWDTQSLYTAKVIDNEYILGQHIGTTDLIGTFDETEKVYVKVNCIKAVPDELIISGEKECMMGEKIQLEALITPDFANEGAIWKSSDESIATVNEKGLVKTLKDGTVTITATATNDDTITDSITITVVAPDTTAPVLTCDTTIAPNNLEIPCAKRFDIFAGFSATDDRDGDITKNIQTEEDFDVCIRGTHTLTYYVKDEAGNISNKITRKITTVWDYQLVFIGHGGCYSGIMNTEEAFLAAATKKGYTAIECDLRVTKDGVFVLCHDETFGSTNVGGTNYAALKDVVLEQTRGNVKYTSKICSLDTYLDICVKYNMIPVIELKWANGVNNNDQSNMSKLMNVIKDKKLLDRVVFLTSMVNCLKWIRNSGYSDVKCQYLVSSIKSEDTLSLCKEYDFDISLNITYNDTAEWIKKYHDAGLKVSSYTFNQYASVKDLQAWIDKGVDYVTVDVLKPIAVEFK